MEKGITFEKLAKLVADDFQKTMDEEGFETFLEMKRCYMWEAQDIREEVESIISELSKKAWEENGETFFMSDDYTFIQIGICEEMSWRDFKKLVFANLK